MAYRRTENVLRRLATPATTPSSMRRGTPAAVRRHGGDPDRAGRRARAGVAAGTVYRYFPGKIELVGALVESVAEREIEAVRRAADAAPGPLSALAAAHRHLRRPRLAQPQARLGGDRGAGRYRHRCGAPAVSPRACRPKSKRASARRSTAAICRSRTRNSPRGACSASLLEGLIGPLAPENIDDPLRIRAKRCRRSRCSRCAGSAWSMPAPAASWCRPCCRTNGRDYCSVVAASQSVTALSARARPSVLPNFSYTAICASAEVPEPTMVRQRCNLGEAAERLGVGGGLLDHLIDEIGDRDRAIVADEGAVHAVALRPPLVLDHDRAGDGVDVAVELRDCGRAGAPASATARRWRWSRRPASGSPARATPGSDA